MIFDSLVILLSFGLTLALTAKIRRILIARALLDHPNERSSHKIPVPRGGGWAFLAVLIPGMLWAETYNPVHTGLIAGTILLAFVSWLDDRKGISPSIRLGTHLFAASLAVFMDLGTPFSLFPSLGGEPAMLFQALPFWLDRTVMIIGWAWFINLYNFMDGIDGITSVETISIAVGVCLLLTALNMNDPFVHMLTLLLIGTSLGFLVFNWHPAKIFLGDIGSVPLGFLTGFALLTLAVKGHIIPALILPLYYLADSGITITRRALRGEKIWQAHRQHFYQQAISGTGRHDKIVFWIILANIGLTGCSLLAVEQPWAGLALAILGVAILLMKMHKTGTRKG